MNPTQYLSRPDLFKQIHIHTDVRLALGWTGVLIAGATALYSYRLEYEKSKPVIWIGLIVYVILARDYTCRSFSLSILHQIHRPLPLTGNLCVFHRRRHHLCRKTQNF